ncbi:double zinc ribbon domain-containing protein, partial [Listeria monocytogenes]|uniref:double zinc ribbon domain-containing protein n=1 Tax=Listeria monocytogenes TaxID=1639 RepID=UPI001A7E0798
MLVGSELTAHNRFRFKMMLRPLLAGFFSLFFPQACLACQEPLVAGERHLCTACRAELPYTDYHLLPAAQNPLGRRFWGKLPVVHT